MVYCLVQVLQERTISQPITIGAVVHEDTKAYGQKLFPLQKSVAFFTQHIGKIGNAQISIIGAFLTEEKHHLEKGANA